MKRTVTETHETKKEVDVQLPYYSKEIDGYIFYAVISEERVIEVQPKGCMIGIRIMDGICLDFPFKNDRIEITEQEFKDAFYEVYNKLIERLETKTEQP